MKRIKTSRFETIGEVKKIYLSEHAAMALATLAESRDRSRSWLTKALLEMVASELALVPDDAPAVRIMAAYTAEAKAEQSGRRRPKEIRLGKLSEDVVAAFDAIAGNVSPYDAAVLFLEGVLADEALSKWLLEVYALGANRDREDIKCIG